MNLVEFQLVSMLGLDQRCIQLLQKKKKLEKQKVLKRMKLRIKLHMRIIYIVYSKVKRLNTR